MPLDLAEAFPLDDRPRVRSVLDALLSYLQGKYLIVGGTAIRYELALRDEPIDRPFNDLDLIVPDASSIDPSVHLDFAIHHYHEVSDRSDFRMVLVHRETGTKVDIFHWKPARPGNGLVRYESPLHGRQAVWLQDLWTQFAVTIFDLEIMRHRAPVDPKQLSDAKTMSPHAFGPLANRVWRELWHDEAPLSLSEAFENAKERAGSEPRSFHTEPWKLYHTRYVCSKCVASPQWPIAPAQEIFDLLKYIEMDGSNVYRP